MRILHLASSHRWTGAAEPATALAEAQIQLGHEVAFACIAGHSFWRRLRRRKIPRIEGLHLHHGIHPIQIQQDVQKLRELVSSRSFDVVHCHLTHDHWLAAVALRGVPGEFRKAVRPILVRTLHRDVIPRGDLLHQWLYRSATDLLITVSRTTRDLATEHFQLPPEKAVWVRGAVDLKRFHPDLDRLRNRDAWKIPRDAPVVGIIARMQPHRGHLTLIDTISDVVAKVPEARYIISGRGEVKNQVKQRMREHPLAKNLMYVGYRKHDLAETYATLDASVLLARGSDGTCRAMLESMACGRPVIGVATGAIGETIEHGKTGWLIPSIDDKRALGEALVEALSDLKRTAEMGRTARARMEADFTQDRRAQDTIAAYERALSRRSHVSSESVQSV